jgi:hypothetical protein
VCVGLLILLVMMYRSRAKGSLFTSLVEQLDSTPMSYD